MPYAKISECTFDDIIGTSIPAGSCWRFSTTTDVPSERHRFNCKRCGAANQIDVCEYCGCAYEGEKE